MRISTTAWLAAILLTFTAARFSAPAPEEQAAGWGKPDPSGVQIRLWAVKRVWHANEAPVLKVDLRNTGIKTATYLGVEEGCVIWVDGHWYANRDPVFTSGFPRITPGAEEDGAITIQFSKDWYTSVAVDRIFLGATFRVDSRQEKYLDLALGKHTVRVGFPPGVHFTTISAVSNDIEIECAAANAPATDPAKDATPYPRDGEAVPQNQKSPRKPTPQAPQVPHA